MPRPVRPAPAPVSDWDTLPPVVRHWVSQLLHPEIIGLLESAPDRQIEIRLYGRGGEARKRPVILLNAGPTERY